MIVKTITSVFYTVVDFIDKILTSLWLDCRQTSMVSISDFEDFEIVDFLMIEEAIKCPVYDIIYYAVLLFSRW